MAKKFREDIEIKSSLANHSWLVTKNMTSSTPDKIAGTSWKNVIVDENWEIMVWDVQRMTTRQTLTPTAIVTANPLVADTVNWFWFWWDLYVSSASYNTTTPTDWNSLVDFDWRANLRISLPNHSAEVNSQANVAWQLYDWETSDNYSADKNNVWSVSQVQTKTWPVAPWTSLSITHQSRIRIDTWIAPVTNWWSIVFANFYPVVTFIPTY